MSAKYATLGLLKKGSILDVKQPGELLKELNGKVWSVSVDTEDKAELIQKFPYSNVIRMDGKSVVRLLSEQTPCAEALPQSPNMEDSICIISANKIDSWQKQHNKAHLKREIAYCGVSKVVLFCLNLNRQRPV